ncbi:PTH11-typeG-protein-coupled receptor [Apiospora phragmitis]|uniref:PTH11-typeG-protein-coupled receptor n=1 Tax=Apiospora phragmitis TaxID=2905665 RepID=A0ABR1TNI0_9PEZI
MSAAALAESNAHLIYVPVGVFIVACPLLVAIRFWSRMRKGGHIGADDYTVLAALVCALASGGLMIAACIYGYGRHVAILAPDDRMQALKYFWICQITYKSCINLTKASILLLYLRIFGNVMWFRWFCIVLTTIIAIYCVASVTATIFQCTPVPRVYDRTLDGTCIDNGKFWFANSGFSIATDLIILCIPLPMVYFLQLPRAQKVALFVVFTLGVLADLSSVVITSCLRITTINVQATTDDQTYDIASTMWTVIEMNVAIVCACLPQIRPLIVMVFPRLMPASHSRDRSERPPNSSSLAKSVSSPAKSNCSHWTDGERQESIAMGAVRKSERSSEEYILSEDRTMYIQKTVRYSVEYSGDGLNPV